jgi:protein-S-isoprenylcysteine O-methyltransferase Ste14
MKLFLRTMTSAVVGLIVLGALVFLPAGTFDYWQGWAFIVVFSVSTNIIGVYLAVKDPVLLERRMKAGPAAETRPAQKIAISLAAIGFLALPAVSGLDHRMGWSSVSPAVSILGDVLVATGLMIDLAVFRVNSFGGSTVETMAGQSVISTGPYALMRHPMYVGVLVMVTGVPLALGSWWGLLFLLLNVPILMWRIIDEEAMLRQDLQGYDAYAEKVRYRLLPYVW